MPSSIDIIHRVTSNSALVCGTFIPRPPYIPSGQWRSFWSDLPEFHTTINHDHFRAIVFGAVIDRPPTVLSGEWYDFWERRSDRRPLMEINAKANSAHMDNLSRRARR